MVVKKFEKCHCVVQTFDPIKRTNEWQLRATQSRQHRPVSTCSDHRRLSYRLRTRRVCTVCASCPWTLVYRHRYYSEIHGLSKWWRMAHECGVYIISDWYRNIACLGWPTVNSTGSAVYRSLSERLWSVHSSLTTRQSTRRVLVDWRHWDVRLGRRGRLSAVHGPDRAGPGMPGHAGLSHGYDWPVSTPARPQNDRPGVSSTWLTHDEDSALYYSRQRRVTGELAVEHRPGRAAVCGWVDVERRRLQASTLLTSQPVLGSLKHILTIATIFSDSSKSNVNHLI